MSRKKIEEASKGVKDSLKRMMGDMVEEDPEFFEEVNQQMTPALQVLVAESIETGMRDLNKGLAAQLTRAYYNPQGGSKNGAWESFQWFLDRLNKLDEEE